MDLERLPELLPDRLTVLDVFDDTEEERLFTVGDWRFTLDDEVLRPAVLVVDPV